MAAEAGGIPPATASRLLDPLLQADDSLLAIALPWWAHQRDTKSLRLAATRCERGLPAGRPDDDAAAAYCRQASRALVALTETDTATALRLLLALPDSTTNRASALRFDVARLLAARGELERAARYLDERPPSGAIVTTVLWNYERALIAEKIGDLARARVCYAFVAAAWIDGDPSLQHFTARARFWERSPGAAAR
jgi:hypothetical protein